MVKKEGEAALHEKLREIDALSAAAIHPNNVKRVIRAIEYFYQTGEKISHHNETERQKESPYNAAYFVLTHDRQVLYDRINRRVDLMIEEGLVEEVKGLLESGCKKNMVSMQGLGYKEIIDYLEGGLSLSEAVALLKRDTRHFAKRQLTWFKRERDVIWLDKREYQDEAALLLKMLSVLREKKIISDSEGTR
jgi:tRNA dimethylallyltransferase